MDSPVPLQLSYDEICQGLHRVLKRYRFLTILGWVIVLAGVASLPIGWNEWRPHGLIDLGLSVGTIVAGLAVVQGSVASLSSYTQLLQGILVEKRSSAQAQAAVDELSALVQEIEAGGWQEAYGAIERLERLVERYAVGKGA